MFAASKLKVLLIIFCLVFLLFLVSEGLLFVSFFWTSFHSLSSPSLEIWPGEGFYVPDPISYGSYFYNPNTWFSGILIFFFLMTTAFMGYVLPFGQMSFWGATVITNLLSPFPCLIEWVCGGHYLYNPTLKRFFLFHFQFPFFFCGFIILHLFYLHFHSSNNPLRLNTNNKIPFFPFIFLKDFFGFILILCLYLLQTHFGISSFSHPDNALEVCGLLTPLHIVPEWYFLCQYAMLKAVPNKNAGFIILLTSIFTLFFFGEIRNLTTFTRLMDYNNGFSISSFFLSLLSSVWLCLVKKMILGEVVIGG